MKHYDQLLQLLKSNNPDNHSVAISIMKSHNWAPQKNHSIYKILLYNDDLLQRCLEMNFDKFLDKIDSYESIDHKHLTIPDAVFKLKNLNRLGFEKGKLLEISNQIVQLKKLKSLNLNSNMLDEMTASILELGELSDLALDNNLFENLLVNHTNNDIVCTILASASLVDTTL
jgi:Leucine-rich repeat (LRR) protein